MRGEGKGERKKNKQRTDVKMMEVQGVNRFKTPTGCMTTTVRHRILLRIVCSHPSHDINMRKEGMGRGTI